MLKNRKILIICLCVMMLGVFSTGAFAADTSEQTTSDFEFDTIEEAEEFVEEYLDALIQQTYFQVDLGLDENMGYTKANPVITGSFEEKHYYSTGSEAWIMGTGRYEYDGFRFVSCSGLVSYLWPSAIERWAQTDAYAQFINNATTIRATYKGVFSVLAKVAGEPKFLDRPYTFTVDYSI